MKSKRKLKKEVKLAIIGILCLITILVIVFSLGKKNSTNDSIKELKGEKLINGLYKYETKEKESLQINVIGDSIYYLTNDERTYKLNIIDIYTNKTHEVGTIKNSICFLSDYLTCIKNEKTTIYDVNLKEIYSSSLDNYNVIPYKDSYLIARNKELYQNDKQFRVIKDDYAKFDIMKYYANKDNTFIEFNSGNNKYIYNVKDDSYTKLDQEDIYFYENGIYYGNKEKITINDLVNNKSKEYTISNNSNIDDISAVKDNLYFYINNGNLIIYNLETNKFKVLDYDFKSSIDKVILRNNYLYLMNRGESPTIYIVKLDELDSTYYSMDEYKEIELNKINEKIKKLNNKYSNVEIIIDSKDIDNYDNWDSKFVNEDRYEYIDEAIDEIANVFDKLGSEFISLFKHDDYKGIRVIIAKKLINSENRAVQEIDGLSFPDKANYNIIITKSDQPFEKIFCHEMMHTIDEHAVNYKYDISGKWYDYNPKDFSYGINQYKELNMQYTTSESDANNAYFVDPYSKINQSEDRARVFENVCYADDVNIIKKHPNLLKKAEYIRDELLKYYPSLNNSKVFDSLK